MTFSKKIASIVCTDNDEEHSVIEFGISILLSKLVNLVTEIIIGCFFSMLAETIIFLIAFSFLRSYSGGYHASSSVKCYVSSSLTMIAALLAIKFIDNDVIYCNCILFGSILCLIYSPIESKNKPLDVIEKQVYRKRALLVAFIILSVITVSYFLHIYKVFSSLSIVMIINGIMLIMGKISFIKTR